MIITNEITVKLRFSSPVPLIGHAARACYAKGDNPDHDSELAAKLVKMKHMEPLENSLFYFTCKIPKFVCAQLNRHRVGIGRCQQSLRYSIAEPTFYWPDDMEMPPYIRMRLENDANILASLSEMSQREREVHQRLVSDLLVVEYRTWLNAREFLSLCERRLHPSAQRECRAVVARMRDELMLTPWAGILWPETPQNAPQKNVP